MISTSEIKVSCVIEAKYAELAVRVLHEAFGLAAAGRVRGAGVTEGGGGERPSGYLDGGPRLSLPRAWGCSCWWARRLPTLTGTGPAFPVDATVPAGEPNAGTDGSAGARDRATGNPSESIAESGKPNSTHRLDINRADANALQALPGIGPALARRIVAYRAAHGPFRESGDLLRVPGIGAQRYAGLQARIRIAEGP